MSLLNPKPAAVKVRKISRLRPTLALVLGSGFSHVLSEIQVDAELPYAKLPGFPQPTVAGHDGRLVIGKLGGRPVLVLSGRVHFYEGYAMEKVTFPTRVLAAYGIKDLLLTNAAGGINRKFRPGDFMLVTDHINFMGENPLRGTPSFVDLTEVYDQELRKRLLGAARISGLKLQRGVYVAVSGPTYETPAEIRAFARMGADAVGMSTAPEAIVARQCGLRVAALSCITNLAAGLGASMVSHEEVLKTGQQVKPAAARLLREFCRLHR